MKVKRESLYVMYSSILPRCGEQWVNNRVRYVNRHVRNELNNIVMSIDFITVNQFIFLFENAASYT